MNIINCYQILGVEPDCSDKDLKTAYRKLARKYHPDINKEPDAADKFKEVQTAYDSICNFKQQRNIFDPLDFMFNFSHQNIWRNIMDKPSSNIKIELEFDSLSNEDSNRLLDILRKEGFNFKRSSVIRMC